MDFSAFDKNESSKDSPTLLKKLRLMEECYSDIVSTGYEKVHPYSDSAWRLFDRVTCDFDDFIEKHNSSVGLMDMIFLEYYLFIQQIPEILCSFKQLGFTHLGEKVNAMMYDSLLLRSHNWFEYTIGRAEIDWWNPYSSEPQSLDLYIQRMCRRHGFDYTQVEYLSTENINIIRNVE